MYWATLSFAVGTCLLFFSFTEFPCFATRCVTKSMIPTVRLEWTLFVSYYFAIGLYLMLYHRLSVRNQTKLPKINRTWNSLHQKFPILPRVTNLDIVHLTGLFTVLALIYGIYYQYYLPKVIEKLANKHLLPGAISSRTLMFTFGHWCDFLIALNLLPVSSKSYFSNYWKISTGYLIRYHQVVGILLTLSVFLHGGSYIYYLSCHENPQYFKDLFMVNEYIFKYFKIPLGVIGTICCFLIVVTSLWSIRRRWYQFFLFCHYTLVPIFLLAAVLHAITNFYFTIPALLMYTLDVSYRLFQRCKSQEALFTLEQSGMIRLETKLLPCKAGQYFYITIPEISSMSHPFSVASISSTGMGFLIQPSGSHTWTDEIVTLIDDDTALVKVALDGPYGLAPFEYQRMNSLIVMVGGSGITTVLPCIHEACEAGIPCHLYWSIRNTSYTQLHYFQKLLKLDDLVISVFVTGHLDLESMPDATILTGLEVHQERMNPSKHLASLMLAYSNSLVGLYTCGPRKLMDSVEDASCLYENILLYRESYEW
jgi:NAD(P)H-flavin reductase